MAPAPPGSASSSRVVAVGCASGALTLLSLPSLRTLASSTALHASPLCSLDLSPTRGVSASRDGVAVVWAVRGLRRLAELVLPPGVPGVARPPPPRAGAGGRARPGRRRARPPPPARIGAVRFHPASAGGVVATAHAAATGGAVVCLWTAAGGDGGDGGGMPLSYTVTASVALLSSPVSALAFSPTGALLLGASADGHLAVATVGSSRGGNSDGGGSNGGGGVSLTPRWSTERTRRPPHLLPVTAVAFSPDGGTAFSASADGTVHVWSAAAVARLSRRRLAASAAITVAVVAVAVRMAATGVPFSGWWLEGRLPVGGSVVAAAVAAAASTAARVAARVATVATAVGGGGWLARLLAAVGGGAAAAKARVGASAGVAHQGL